MAETYSLVDLEAENVKEQIRSRRARLRQMVTCASSLLTVAVVAKGAFQ